MGGDELGAGNLISGNDYGIGVIGASSNRILANYIGTDVTGTKKLGTGLQGVRLAEGAIDNDVGGTSAEARNLISGNDTGVHITGNETTGNAVLGNYIGLDVTGAVKISNAFGVAISAGAHGNTVGGVDAGSRNVISGSFLAAVSISGPGTTANRILGNYIGLDHSGSVRIQNGWGVFLTDSAGGNFIGGLEPGARNVISGNGSGVHFEDPFVDDNQILGNYIGTDTTGTQPVGNGFGILVGGGARGTIIGGPGVAGNVISGNSVGVFVLAGTLDTMILGNYIGTDFTGTNPIGNGIGVYLLEPRSAQVGGPSIDGANLISGNFSSGIQIFGRATGVFVFGNKIGLDAPGTAALSNGIGILLQQSVGSTIGGIGAGAGNIIANSDGTGVQMVNGHSNAVRGNSIYANGDVGIELIEANNSQPPPSITSVTSGGGNVTISGTLQAAANTTYAIDLFKNVRCDPSGSGEGEVYLGSLTTTTDGSGMTNFTGMFSGDLLTGQIITATATDPSGNTSEFSACFAAPMPPAPGRRVDVSASATAIPSMDVFQFGATPRPQLFSSDGDAPGEPRVVFQTVIEPRILVGTANQNSRTGSGCVKPHTHEVHQELTPALCADFVFFVPLW